MTIQLTQKLRQEINKGILEADNLIKREMNISPDLRNNEIVLKYTEYIVKMNKALVNGVL